MKEKLYKFFLSAVLYIVVNNYAGNFLVMPEGSLIGPAGFLPPLFGIMWGPVAAFGSMLGALISEYEDWYMLSEILWRKGMTECIWQGMLLFLNCGFWAFISAYMSWRLWHSILVFKDEPLFVLRANIILKYVAIMTITSLTVSLFLAMTTYEKDMLRVIDGITVKWGSAGEYAFMCFLNDLHCTTFYGLICFFFLVSYDYPFHRPDPTKISDSETTEMPVMKRVFDTFFICAVFVSFFFCLPSNVDYEIPRLITGICLALYMFRPFSPPPKDSTKHEKILFRDSIENVRKIAAIFFTFLFILFLVLDTSGTIYGLTRPDTWQQFNEECLMMMSVSLVALLYMLLRRRHSIMTDFVILEVVTVFVSAFALGIVCFKITDKITGQKVEDSLAEMSIICRERLKRTFDGIQVSVNDIQDLALAELESYDALKNDENYRAAYLKKTEQLFEAIASNTDGSIAFYLRLNPDFAGPSGGFSWGREKNRWEGTAASFYRRNPIDLSKYSPDDTENVGWYYIPVSRGNATWIEPYVDPIVQVYVISYVSPLYIDGNFIGVVGMDIDFDYLIHEVRRMSVYNYGYAYLTDRTGHVLYHQRFSQGELFQPSEDFREMETYLTNGIWLGIAMPKYRIYADRNSLLMHLISVMLAVAILVSFLSVYLASRGIRPLIALTEAAQKIAEGNLNVELPGESKNELGVLVRSIREMVSKLEIYVYRDKLTGVRNTTAYARKCEELANSENYAIVVFDLNFLKKTNDTYGHEAGNLLIRGTADLIEKIFVNDSVFRIGGDEFVAILEGDDFKCRDELIAAFDKELAGKIFTVKDKEIPLSIARGVGIWREGSDYAKIFREADEAMYANKVEIKKAFGYKAER